ncbi:MAG TPA: rod shape-determining protein MreC [Gemmatimonadaceae bacterium]|nr:rod shape-determining protein MreC [Gemmatimonadaceae bacterium]
MAPSGRTSSRRDTVLLVACLTLGIVTRALPDTLKEPVAGALRTTVLAPLVALQRDAELSRRAWLDRNETLRAADSVALQASSLGPVRRENEQLRRLLGLGARLKWGFVPAEVLRGRGIAEEYTMILAAGARAGVQPFSPVVSPDGLLGMVKTVDPTLSIAILWSHPDFRVSAMTADESAFGIVAAHLDGEEGRNLLELRGVPTRSTLVPGTVLWSSGVGGNFPRGIPIGTVLGEAKDPAEVWARTYIVEPTVNPAEVDAVMVLRPERRDSSLANVWDSPNAVAGGVRRVVAAGDSLARLRAEDSTAAARRAAQAAQAAVTVPQRDTATTAPPRPRPAPAPVPRDTVPRDTVPPRPDSVRATRDTVAPPRDTVSPPRDSVRPPPDTGGAPPGTSLPHSSADHPDPVQRPLRR